MTKEIQNFRKKFDNIDNQILELLNKRNQLSKEMGEYKRKQGLKIKDIKRETKLIKNLEKRAEKNNLNKKYIKQIFKTILRSSRKTQKKIK